MKLGSRICVLEVKFLHVEQSMFERKLMVIDEAVRHKHKH
jgi:hypothetical protein